MKLNHREKCIVGIGLLIGIAIVGHFKVVEPFYLEKGRIKKEIKKKNILIDKYRSLLSRKDVIKEEYTIYKERGEEMLLQLLKGDSMSIAAAELQKILHEIAKNLNVMIQSEKILDPVRNSFITSVPVEIIVKTNLRKLTEFIHYTTNHKKLININLLKMKVHKRVLPQEKEIIEAKIETRGFFIEKHLQEENNS